MRLVLITDPKYDDDTILRVATAVCESVRGTCVQLRDRRASSGCAALAQRLRQMTRDLGAMLILNRNVLLAKEVQADGVHLDVSDLARARENLPDAIFSVPAHSNDDVREALALGASWALVSPIFQTPGKQPPRGLDAIREAQAIAKQRMTIVALGGIASSNADSCFEAGADGVACIRALFESAKPEEVAARMVRLAPIC